MHHFAHKSGTECNFAYESMLHLLAKEKIRKAFMESRTFNLQFEYRSYCRNEKTCPFFHYTECYMSSQRAFNLKDFYDSCEQEISYDKIRRRSDLKLFSSYHPNREPIYIEFCVTHPSETGKLHSGAKIIEVQIDSENTISRLVEQGFMEPRIDEEYDDDGNLKRNERLSLYGFKKSDYNADMTNNIGFTRFILYRSGKSRIFKDFCKCNELRRSSPYSLYERCYFTDSTFGLYDEACLEAYEKYHIPNCMACVNYVNSYNGMGKICRMYKYLQIPLYEDFDTGKAKICHCFNARQQTESDPRDEKTQYKEFF